MRLSRLWSCEAGAKDLSAGRRAFVALRRDERWADVARYVRVMKALLRGEDAEWDGALVRMLHRSRFAPARPIDVPFVIAAAGPKGIAVARELGDGVFGAPAPVPGFPWSVVLTFGTVLDDGEDPGAERVLAAAGHAAPVLFHYALENKQLGLLPNGAECACSSRTGTSAAGSRRCTATD